MPALRAFFSSSEIVESTYVLERKCHAIDLLIVQSRYQHGQRTWDECSSLHGSFLRWAHPVLF